MISTSVGAEGLDVQNGRELILADDPIDFAEAICSLLRNHGLRRKYEEAALACAGQHDWFRVAKSFEAVLQRVLQPVRQRFSVDRPLVAV